MSSIETPSEVSGDRALSPAAADFAIWVVSFASAAGAFFPPCSSTSSYCAVSALVSAVDFAVPVRAVSIAFESFTKPTCSVLVWMPRSFATDDHSEAVAVSMPVVRCSASVDFARSSVAPTAPLMNFVAP